jgi:hypothetical protein
MVGDVLPKLYRSLLKAGAGNYLYGEYFFNTLRSKDYSLGAHLHHLSYRGTISGYGFSGFSDNTTELFGKKFFRKHTLSANTGFDRNAVHYYGYDTALVKISDYDLIKQVYNNFSAGISLQSHYTDSVHINYLLGLKYRNLFDFYGTSENNFLAEADFSGFYEKQLIRVPLAVDFYNNKFESLTENSAVIRLNPHLIASGEKWNTQIGLGAAIEASENDNSRFLFYPNIDFNYNIAHNIIIPYAGVAGGLKKNSLKTVTDENPFLLPNPDLKNTNTKWELYAGLRGSISRAVSYNVRTSYSKNENFWFFVNDNRDLAKKGFSVIYNDANIWNIHGECQYQHTEKLKMIIQGDFNRYNFGPLPEFSYFVRKPWHRPSLQLNFSANYNLKNKIIAKADIFFIGKRHAYYTEENTNPFIDVLATSVKTMPVVVDGNLGLEYRYNKKLSAFLTLNNLGFKRYYLWNNYYSNGFNFLAGISMGF